MRSGTVGSVLRVLALADTHLGFDLPRRPRVERRRRGPDFFSSYERALAPAYAGEVDVVVHGGDVLFRSKVPPSLVERAFAPLRALADGGIDVIVVPGNHERSHIPHALLVRHPRIHVFDRPRTVVLCRGGSRYALGGFPYHRAVRAAFASLVDETGLLATAADARVLCMHHCFEGARVGAHDFTFRHAPDVVAARSLPEGLALVLSGHMHRHQLLAHDLGGRRLRAPVLYPGSTERTSFAERLETKGAVTFSIVPGPSGGSLGSWAFHALPARPMIVHELRARDALEASREIDEVIDRAPPDAVLQLRVSSLELAPALGAARLRALAPAMNVTVAWPRH